MHGPAPSLLGRPFKAALPTMKAKSLGLGRSSTVPLQPRGSRVVALARPAKAGPGPAQQAAPPAGAKKKELSGVHLYTAGTPNGWKVSTLLAELEVPYTMHTVDLRAGEQRQEKFLAINPVGKIPAIVDYDAGGLKIFESGAILCYLADSRDAHHTLLPQPLGQRAEVLTWTFFQTSTLHPAAASVIAPLVLGAPSTKDQLERNLAELKRLLWVLNARLGQGGGWLEAGRYTIADLAHVGSMVMLKAVLGLDLEGDFPNIHDWLGRMLARKAVQEGMRVPEGGLGDEASREGARRTALERAKEYGIEL